MKNLIILTICFFLANCNASKQSSQDANTIQVIKFMYLYEYPIAVYEKSFWAMKNEEHASFAIEFEGKTFLDEIKSISNKECSNFDFLNYAFIIKRQGKDNDTVYADTALRTWKFKINGETECRYDEKGIYTEFLRQQYPFFKDCW